MRFDVLTLFPEIIENFCGSSIIGRGITAGFVEVTAHNIRDYSHTKHKNVDDTPYGGGYGMLMSAPPICECHAAVLPLSDVPRERTRTVFAAPSGKLFDHKTALRLRRDYDRLIILCGHYEGVDSRAVALCCDEVISVGDYVLTGGELPACVIIDAVSRLVDGVLPCRECYERESVASGLLEYPQFTRPEEYMGLRVPSVLLNGNHADIERWRFTQALLETQKNRPDLL